MMMVVSFPTFTFHVLFLQQCLLALVLSWEWDATKASETTTAIISSTHQHDGPPFQGMSLQDYNAAFNLASYCMDGDGYMCAMNRKMCESAGRTWKKRFGFESEQAWEAAVTEEMKRRLTPGIDGHDEEVGLWHVEAPSAMKLSNAIIARLEGNLGLSLEKFLVSEDGKQIFTISGTPAEIVEPLLNAGFSRLTPVPRSLKMSPRLFEPVREPPQPWTQLEEYEVEEEDEVVEAGSGFELEVQLLPEGMRKASLSTSGDTKRAISSGPQPLSTSWQRSIVDDVVVEAQGPSQFSIKGLNTRSQAYAAAMELAKDSATEMIEPAEPIQEFWHNGAGILQSGDRENFPLWDIGIHGEGQIAGVRDGGFKIHTECYIRDKNHRDIEVEDYVLTDIQDHSKLVQLWGEFSNLNKGWHGSSCAKTLAGYAELNCGGPKVDGKLRTGVSYRAKLVLQAYKAIPGGWLAAAYAAGARVHSNSYGSGATTAAYGAKAREIDEFMYTNEDMLVLYAAGNMGTSGITSQCLTKNGVCVGSIEGEQKVPGFSGRGPAGDGRIKPDMLALGAHGTSVATPTLAGAAVLIQQYFMDGFYPKGVQTEGKGFVPTAALIKAVMVNSGEHAEVLLYPTVEEAFPSMDQGFGSTRLKNVLVTPASPQGLVTLVHGVWSPGCETCPKLKDQGTKTIPIQIGSGARGNGLPLRVTLTWTDYPSQGSSNKALVNDLDLSLELDGNTYHPNGADEPDHLNTVERIIIDDPKPSTTYTLRVKASQVPRGPQTYGLVISGPLLSDDTEEEPPCVPGGDSPACQKDFMCGGEACFHVSDELFNRFGATTYCKDYKDGWGLACPVSSEENLAIASSLSNKGEANDDPNSLMGWLGYFVTDKSKLTCFGNKDVVVEKYSNWDNGENPEEWDTPPAYKASNVGIRDTGRWATELRTSQSRAVCQNYNSKGAFSTEPGLLEEEGTQTPVLLFVATGCGVLVVVVLAVTLRRYRSTSDAGQKKALMVASGAKKEVGMEEGIIPETRNPMHWRVSLGKSLV